jgi:hypothetical protein
VSLLDDLLREPQPILPTQGEVEEDLRAILDRHLGEDGNSVLVRMVVCHEVDRYMTAWPPTTPWPAVPGTTFGELFPVVLIVGATLHLDFVRKGRATS